MKTFSRLSFAALALVLFFNAFAVTEAKAQQINEILKRMETHRQNLTSLRANVMMVKYDPVLKAADTYEGTSMYLPLKGRDALVRIDWAKPAQETLAVVKGQYIVYRPRLNQYFTGSTKDAKGSGKANNALSFMNMSKAELKANYNIVYIGEEKVSDGTRTAHLQLNPKTAQNYKSAELWVDKDGMPIQAKVIEKSNDTTTIFLSNIKKNENINANLFKVQLPKDAKQIKG